MGTKTILMLFLVLDISFAMDITVETDIGTITGETEDISFIDGTQLQITKFLGIPYAEPPRRFAKPIEMTANLGNFTAKTRPPTCFQNPVYLSWFGVYFNIDVNSVNFDENCLYLNIYVPGRLQPNDTTKFSVMIWIYGGSFQFGDQDVYESKEFAGLNNVILVSLNYRLSVLGFLSATEYNLSGNYGLWDQHLAIKWVHDHIEHFGGDPAAITIFGESAGSASVLYQVLYSGNEGLFQRAIAQSGSVNSPWAFDKNPTAAFLDFAEKSDCLDTDHDETINCLQNLTMANLKTLISDKEVFLPVVDGEFVKYDAQHIFLNGSNEAWYILKQMGKYDIIIGVTSADGAVEIKGVDGLITQSGQDISNGYRKIDFENLIVPHIIKKVKVKQTDTLQQAVIQNYVDWSEPENTRSVFLKTLDLLSDIMFNAGTVQTLSAHSSTGENGRLYFYLFDSKSPFSDSRYSGAAHFDDVSYVLGFPAIFVWKYGDLNLTISQTEIDLSKELMLYWTNFAKTGDPNRGSDISPPTSWPQYNTQTQKYIRFTSNVTSFPVESRFAASRMNFWNELVPVLLEKCDKVCQECEVHSIATKVQIHPGLLLILSLVVFQ